jgi:hypothetical protein
MPGGIPLGLVAAEVRDDGTLHDELHLMRHSLQYLDELQTTNSTLVNLSRRYVTSEPHAEMKPRSGDA